jgi:cytochrome c oxidase subunit 4
MATSHTPLTNAPDAAGAPDAHGHGHDEHFHPGARTYVIVGIILTLITIAEVWAYYIPSFVASRAFVPVLLILSAVKFGTVVLFYMHLKYDHRLFRALFTGPFLIAAVTMVALMFLFGNFAVRLGLLT